MSAPRLLTSLSNIRASGLAALAVGAVVVGASTLLAQERYDPARGNFPSSPVRTDWADDFGDDLPAFVSAVDGYAELERAGQTSRDIENVPVQAGDRLRTTRGRAELLFDDGSTLSLDEHTSVVLVSATSVDLQSGRIRAQWRNRDGLTGLSVHTIAGRMLVRSAGDYRVTLSASRRGEPEIEVAAASGSAELINEAGRTLVRERTRALTVAGMAPSLPYRFDIPRDEFERWTDDAERERYGVESARYLPEELRYYGGVFDRHGYWRNHVTYGWVWYPRVSVGWRPYYGGRWSFVVGFGYSWVGGSRWAWPTHHYGRWDCVGTTWFWVPSRPVQRRAMGYAVPRASYTDRVTYYQRPASSRGVQQRGVGNVSPRVNEPRGGYTSPSSSPSRAVPRADTRGDSRPVGRPEAARPEPRQENRSEPRAIPRREVSPRPESRPSESRPAETRPASRTTSERSAPRATSERPSEPRRSAPSVAPRSTPPQRSAPSATSAPPSGSRTPSRASGGNSSSSGTARRRGGD